MQPLDALKFAAIVGGVPSGIHSGAPITGFALDSGEVKPGDLFIAIRGANVDGHDYAPKACSAGAVASLVGQMVEGPYILVPNVVQALAQFAEHMRQTFTGPVVAITGSAGKTTTKELVAAALSPLGPVLRTEGNRNSEFSSPLLWADLAEQTKAVVVEMGMRGFGQIRHLASFTKPTIGVITNIGFSHIEMVGGREGIAKAKAELLDDLPTNGWGVFWAEDDYIDELRKRCPAPVRTFGFSNNADCRIIGYSATSWRSCHIEGRVYDHPFHATLPAAGRHIALNAACAVLTASLAGVAPADASDALSEAKLPPMRMEIMEHGGVTYVLDAYNASPPSVVAAIQTLADMPTKRRRIVVLGEMRELGVYSVQGHLEVGAAIASSNIDLAILVGEPARAIGAGAEGNGFPSNSIRYVEGLEEISEFFQTLFEGDTVLIKGSRALGLERSLDFLKEPVI